MKFEKSATSSKPWTERQIRRRSGNTNNQSDLERVAFTPQRPGEHQRTTRIDPTMYWGAHHPPMIDEYLTTQMSSIRAVKPDDREDEEEHSIPHLTPPGVVSWATMHVHGRESKLRQADPLSSPACMSPMVGPQDILVWIEPADIKCFLRPTDEELEDLWNKALLIYTAHILRECMGYQELRKCTYAASVLKMVTHPQVLYINTDEVDAITGHPVYAQKMLEGLYEHDDEGSYLVTQWKDARYMTDWKVGDMPEKMTYTPRYDIDTKPHLSSLTRETSGLTTVGLQTALPAHFMIETGLKREPGINHRITGREKEIDPWYHVYDSLRKRFSGEVYQPLYDLMVKSKDDWVGKVWEGDEGLVEIIKITSAKATTPLQDIANNSCKFYRRLMGRPISEVKQEPDLELSASQDKCTDYLVDGNYVRFDSREYIELLKAVDNAKGYAIMQAKCPRRFKWTSDKAWEDSLDIRLNHRLHRLRTRKQGIRDSELGKAAKADSECRIADGWNIMCDRVAERKYDDSTAREYQWLWIIFTIEKHHVLEDNIFNWAAKLDYTPVLLTWAQGMVRQSVPVRTLTGLHAFHGFKYSERDPGSFSTDEWIPDIEDSPLQWLEDRRKNHWELRQKIGTFISAMMHVYHVHEVYIPSMLGLKDEIWHQWCMQWYMYKRDLSVCQNPLETGYAIRYESACILAYAYSCIRVSESTVTTASAKKTAVKITMDPPSCPFCGNLWMKHEKDNLTAAITSLQAHCLNENSCVVSQISGSGPMIGNFGIDLIEREMLVLEARLNTSGNLDFEPNFEWTVMAANHKLITVRKQMLQDLRDNYSLGNLSEDNQIGTNISIWRAIGSGSIFAIKGMHHSSFDVMQKENEMCGEILRQWIASYKEESPHATIHKFGNSAGAIMWTADFKITLPPKLTKGLHPTSFAIPEDSVRIWLPTKGILPMGCALGLPGYGLIHPHNISAAVWDRTGMMGPTEGFEPMSLAPTWDIRPGYSDAERMASRITEWKAPEEEIFNARPVLPPIGSASHIVRSNTEEALQADRDRWFEGRHVGECRQPRDQSRAQAILEAGQMMISGERDLLGDLYVMGQGCVHLRCYLHLVHCTQLGLRDSKRITITEIRGVVDEVISNGWLHGNPKKDYSDILMSKDLKGLTRDGRIKGKKLRHEIWNYSA